MRLYGNDGVRACLRQSELDFIPNMRDNNRTMTYAPETETYTEKPSMVSNILAIAGFVVVAGVALWGIGHLASLSRSMLSSTFSSQKEIIVTAPATTTSQTPFTLSWKYSPKSEGSYALLYQCYDGLRVEEQSAAGTMSDIPCGSAFILGSEKQVTLAARIASTDTGINLPISVLFLPNGTSTMTEAQGTASIAVLPSSTSLDTGNSPILTPEAPLMRDTTKSTAPTPTKKSVAGGVPDLAVSIISIDSTSATFDIRNDGNAASGSYYFSAQLPVAGGYAYTSPLQASLAPGAHVLSTLRFSQSTNTNTFSVSVDPSNTVRESNENNNTAVQSFSNGAYYPTTSYSYSNTSYPPFPYQYQIGNTQPMYY